MLLALLLLTTVSGESTKAHSSSDAFVYPQFQSEAGVVVFGKTLFELGGQQYYMAKPEGPTDTYSHSRMCTYTIPAGMTAIFPTEPRLADRFRDLTSVYYYCQLHNGEDCPIDGSMGCRPKSWWLGVNSQIPISALIGYLLGMGVGIVIGYAIRKV